MNLSTSNVIAIISILVSLLFGGGWLSSYFAAKSKYKNDFLLPLATLLEQNKRIFDELTDDINLDALEYAPDYIQQEFNQLDDSNPMKSLWRFRIQTLINNNEMAKTRIVENISAVKNEELKQELGNFLFHVQKFNDIWRRIQSDTPIEPGINPATNLLGERYPKDLDRLLREEISAQ